MKRIYLFLTMIAAILMVGCTDDVIEPENPPQEEKEVILFSIGVNDGVVTKADKPLEGEDKIYNLTALLFKNSDGTLAYSARIESEEGDADYIEDMKINPDTYDIILIANTANTFDGVTRETLNNYFDDITTQKQSNLLMVSRLFEGVEMGYLPDNVNGGYYRRTYCYLDGEAENVAEHFSDRKNNIYGDGTGQIASVELVRLSSRIQLESVKVDFTENLEGATFRLDSVYLVNARPGTKFIPEVKDEGTASKWYSYEAAPATAPSYYRGAPGDGFEIIYDMIAKSSKAESAFLMDYYTGFENADIINIADGETKKFYTIDNGEKVLSKDIFSCYVFENHATYEYREEDKTMYDTRMIVCGEIILPEGQKLGQCYYHIPVKGEDFQLVRNKIYRINIVIRSYGYNNPDGITDPKNPGAEIYPGDNNAKFDVKVTVSDWKVINQYEEEKL